MRGELGFSDSLLPKKAGVKPKTRRRVRVLSEAEKCFGSQHIRTGGVRPFELSTEDIVTGYIQIYMYLFFIFFSFFLGFGCIERLFGS